MPGYPPGLLPTSIRADVPTAWITVAHVVLSEGFPSGTKASIAIALIGAESGRIPNRRNTYGNEPATSTDRGWWQINDHWHPEVSDAEADDPFASTRAALRISGAGSDFSPWSAFNNGAYEKYLDHAKIALDGASRERKQYERAEAALAQRAPLEAAIAGLRLELAQSRAETAAAVAETGVALSEINVLRDRASRAVEVLEEGGVV